MEAIKSWVMTICFAAIAAGMAGIIAPSGNLEKIFKYVISLFFLACILVPVFNLKNIKIDEFIPAVSQSSTDSNSQPDFVARQAIDQTKSNLSDLICGCCKTYGVTPLFVYIDVSQSSGGQINVTGCKAILNKQDIVKKNELKTAVKDQLGLDIDFEAKEDTN